MHRLRPTAWHSRAVLLALVIAGCRDTQPTAAPEFTATDAPHAPTITLSDACARTCSLTDDSQPFNWAKSTPTDTAGASVTVAHIRIAGAPGATVTLAMEDTATAAASPLSTTALLIVRVSDAERRYSLMELARGVTIHEFATLDTVMIEYRIPRGISITPSSTSRLVQQISAGASIIDESRVWVRPRSLLKFLAAGTSCTVSAPGLICADSESTVTMDPSYRAYTGFASTPCCGQSVRLTITFSIPMSAVTVTASDPDFPGNTVTAFDAVGIQLDQQSFVGDNKPGVLTRDTRTVSGDGIRSIVLDAPIGEYVYYEPIVTVVGTAPVPPTITSVSPNPIVPGANATIIGTNFSGTAVANVVSIGGQQAKVTSATKTQLSVVVPCTSSGTIDVTVTNAGLSSAPFSHPLQVAQQVVPVGQSVVMPSAAASACNELPSASGTARYVLTVVNAQPDPNASSQLQLSAARLGTPGPFNGELRAAAARSYAASPIPPTRGGGLDLDAGVQRLRARQRRAHMDLLLKNAQIYERFRSQTDAAVASRSLLSSAPSPTPTPPPATRSFRIPNKNALCNSFWVTTGTRVFYNGKIAIYEDTATPAAFKAQLNAQMAAYYAELGNQFNTQMEPILRDHFGDVLLRDAATDNNGVMVVLFTPRMTQEQWDLQAYVVTCDQRPMDDRTKRVDGGPYTGSGTNGGSNFGEYVYATLPTVGGSGFGVGSINNWYSNMRSTLIHEAKHIVSMSARTVAKAPNQERGWLEEGLASIAEELWMRLAVDNLRWKDSIGSGDAATPINLYCDAQTTTPCTSGLRLIMFPHFAALHGSLSNPGTISPLGATPVDVSRDYYSESWSLIRYAADRYAATERDFFTALTATTDTGVTNFELRTGTKLEKLLALRSLSMYADHFPGLTNASPDISFPTWNLRDIYTHLNGSTWYAAPGQPYPLVPIPLAFGSATTTPVALLRGGTSLWYELSGTQTAPQLLRLEGNAGAALPANIRLAIARLQ